MQPSVNKSIFELKNIFEEKLAGFEARLNNETSGSVSVEGLRDDFSAFKAFVMQSLKVLQQQVDCMARDVETMEMRSRRKMLLFHGVAEQKEEETAQLVARVVQQDIKMTSFKAEDIKRCHRMGRLSSTGNARPILVKFHSTVVRDSVWFSKIKLKGTGTTLSEFLCRTRHRVFLAVREKFGIAKAWTKEGFIFVQGLDGVRHRITTFAELDSIKVTEKAAPANTATSTAAPKTRRAAATTKKM